MEKGAILAPAITNVLVFTLTFGIAIISLI